MRKKRLCISIDNALGIERVIAALGGVGEAAVALGYSQGTVSYWRKKKGITSTRGIRVVLRKCKEIDLPMTADELLPPE
jgi:hypothetical protein